MIKLVISRRYSKFRMNMPFILYMYIYNFFNKFYEVFMYLKKHSTIYYMIRTHKKERKRKKKKEGLTI